MAYLAEPFLCTLIRFPTVLNFRVRDKRFGGLGKPTLGCGAVQLNDYLPWKAARGKKARSRDNFKNNRDLLLEKNAETDVQKCLEKIEHSLRGGAEPEAELLVVPEYEGGDGGYAAMFVGMGTEPHSPPPASTVNPIAGNGSIYDSNSPRNAASLGRQKVGIAESHGVHSKVQTARSILKTAAGNNGDWEYENDVKQWMLDPAKERVVASAAGGKGGARDEVGGELEVVFPFLDAPFSLFELRRGDDLQPQGQMTTKDSAARRPLPPQGRVDETTARRILSTKHTSVLISCPPPPPPRHPHPTHRLFLFELSFVAFFGLQVSGCAKGMIRVVDHSQTEEEKTQKDEEDIPFPIHLDSLLKTQRVWVRVRTPCAQLRYHARSKK